VGKPQEGPCGRQSSTSGFCCWAQLMKLGAIALFVYKAQLQKRLISSFQSTPTAQP
jgi:hypothetical protein